MGCLLGKMDEGEELGQACSSCSVIVPAGADRSLAVGLRGAWGPTAVPPRQQKGLQRLLQGQSPAQAEAGQARTSAQVSPDTYSFPDVAIAFRTYLYVNTAGNARGLLGRSVLATGVRTVVRRITNPPTSILFFSEPCTCLSRADVQVVHKSLRYCLNSALEKAELSRSIQQKVFKCLLQT